MITLEDRKRIKELRVMVPSDQIAEIMIFDELRELNKNIKELTEELKFVNKK